jgi:glutamyl-tRNA synthetase
VLGPDGARLAKRHGSVTLREVAPADALRWMEASLGLPAAEDPHELIAAFDPATLPRTPTVYGA